MRICRCRGTRAFAVTYYDFGFVTYAICAHCLHCECAALITHFVVAAHHQATLFEFEGMLDGKSQPTTIALFLQILQL